MPRLSGSRTTSRMSTVIPRLITGAGSGLLVIGPLWATWVYGHVGPSAPFLVASAIMTFVALLAFQIPLVARPEPELAGV